MDREKVFNQCMSSRSPGPVEDLRRAAVLCRSFILDGSGYSAMFLNMCETSVRDKERGCSPFSHQLCVSGIADGLARVSTLLTLHRMSVLLDCATGWRDVALAVDVLSAQRWSVESRATNAKR